ncbi:MAG: hypothetical protein QNJ78_12860 [Gammaproteobacteria bacterium]|nr:hypothetical protein [Gammaproteobacteria bacterium]
MKQTLHKILAMTAIASLAMSGYAFAHHPSEDMNPNFDTITDTISDNHMTVIDGMMEDDSLMANTSQGMDGGEANTAAGDGANANQTSNVGAAPTAAPGISNAGQARAGARNQNR